MWREGKTTEDSIIFDSLSTEEQIRILQDVKMRDDVLSTDDSSDNDLNDDNKHNPTPKIIKNNDTQSSNSKTEPSSSTNENSDATATSKLQQNVQNGAEGWDKHETDRLPQGKLVRLFYLAYDWLDY